MAHKHEYFTESESSSVDSDDFEDFLTRECYYDWLADIEINYDVDHPKTKRVILDKLKEKKKLYRYINKNNLVKAEKLLNNK